MNNTPSFLFHYQFHLISIALLNNPEVFHSSPLNIQIPGFSPVSSDYYFFQPVSLKESFHLKIHIFLSEQQQPVHLLILYFLNLQAQADYFYSENLYYFPVLHSEKYSLCPLLHKRKFSYPQNQNFPCLPYPPVLNLAFQVLLFFHFLPAFLHCLFPQPVIFQYLLPSKNHKLYQNPFLCP